MFAAVRVMVPPLYPTRDCAWSVPLSASESPCMVRLPALPPFTLPLGLITHPPLTSMSAPAMTATPCPVTVSSRILTEPPLV